MTRMRRRVAAVMASQLVPHDVRARALRAAGLKIGRGAWVMWGTLFTHYRSEIGAHAYVAPGCYFDDRAPVTIGNAVHVAPGCRLLTASHAVGDSGCRAGALFCAPIAIGDGAWLGAGVTVLPGVTIGAGCVVAAGSVVVRDCMKDGLYAGVPALRKRDLSQGDAITPVSSEIFPDDATVLCRTN